MFLKIIELVRYMEYDDSAFNPFDYSFHFKKEMESAQEYVFEETLNGNALVHKKQKRKKENVFPKEEAIHWLSVPYVPKTEAILGFLCFLDNKQRHYVQKKLGDSSDINLFYCVLSELDIEENWEKFLFEYRKKIAIKWCLDNGIVYSEKE